MGVGAVYFYDRDDPGDDDSKWELIYELEDQSTSFGPGGNFGRDVAIDESNTLIVGAPYELNGDDEVVGALFVYLETENAPGKWEPLGTGPVHPPVDPTISNVNGEFGFSVALDDSTAVVGARFAAVAGNEKAGAAYIYAIPSDKDGEVQLKQTLKPTSAKADLEFGFSLALKHGNLVIGERNSAGLGYTYLFYEDPDGTWLLSDGQAGASGSGSEFGYAVAVTEDILLVGAPQSDSASGSVSSYELDEECPAPLEFLAPPAPSSKRSVPRPPALRYTAWTSLSETERQVARVYLDYDQEVSAVLPIAVLFSQLLAFTHEYLNSTTDVGQPWRKRG